MFLVHNFLGRDDFSTADFHVICCALFGKSLVQFCLLISICEAWQWSGMRNLRRVGKDAGPTWSHLRTKVHVV